MLKSATIVFFKPFIYVILHVLHYRCQFAALRHAQALPWLRRNDSPNTTQMNAIGHVAIGERATPIAPLLPEILATVEIGAKRAPANLPYGVIVKNRHLP